MENRVCLQLGVKGQMINECTKIMRMTIPSLSSKTALNVDLTLSHSFIPCRISSGGIAGRSICMDLLVHTTATILIDPNI